MKLLALIFLVISCAHQEVLRSPSSLPVETLNWEHWPHDREGCHNRRDDFLKKYSSTKVTYSKLYHTDCNVASGRWRDFFTGEFITDAKEAVVTTVVPFQHLRRKGMKDMPLVRVHGMNRDSDYFIILKKDGEGLKNYLKNVSFPESAPVGNPYRCEFWGMWKDMKEKWSISFKKSEKKFLEEKITECSRGNAYERRYFKHWSIIDGKSCNTRIESLRRDSLTSPVPLTSEPCSRFESGSWFDFYTGDTLTDPKVIDIDHFVPLKNAFISGGWAWPWWKKEEYANYQKDPFHLVSVSARENRKKGAGHPGQYMPPYEGYFCDYLKQWVAIKLRWRLSFSPEEAASIHVLSMKCTVDIKKDLEEIVDLFVEKPRKGPKEPQADNTEED
jgi:hypothetical protein